MNAMGSRDFVLSIYDTVADPSLWPGVLDEFVGRINAAGCIVFEWDKISGENRLATPYLSSRYERDKVHAYLNAFHALEVEDQAKFEAWSLKTDEINLIGDSVLAESYEALRERPNVKALLQNGIFHRYGGLLNKDNNQLARFSIQLHKSRGPLTDSEKAYMDRMLPHFAKAFDLGRPAVQLKSQNSSLLEALDRLTIGVCILDDRARLVHSNEEFRRQLDECAVYSLSENGVLNLKSDKSQKVLADLMDSPLKHGRFGARPRKEAVPLKDGAFLCVELSPLNRSEDMGTNLFGGYILYSSDTSRPVQCQTAPIRTMFGLTASEAEVLNRIADGRSNQEIADERGRSVATVQSQIKSIFMKTDCRNRTQLVRLMMAYGTDLLRNDAN